MSLKNEKIFNNIIYQDIFYNHKVLGSFDYFLIICITHYELNIKVIDINKLKFYSASYQTG